MKIKINNEALALALGEKPNAIVNVEDKNGIPVKREWRNRLKDARIDNCVEVITEKKAVNND